MSSRPYRSPFRTRVNTLISAAAMLACAAMPVLADSARTAPVGPGDILEITVYGDESVTRALSGRFRVGDGGTLYYPLLGRIDVSRKSATEIGEILRDKLESQLPVILSSVTIAEFAPVYLTGDAIRTGPFPFDPGMTVLDLVLDAGGFIRDDLTDDRRTRLEEELAKLELEQFSLRVRRARLAAELAGHPFDTAPFEEDAAPVGAEGILEAERAIFEMRLRTLESRESTYEAQKLGYEQEISSVEKAIALHDEEIGLIEQQLGARETLARKGFASESTLSDLKRLLTSARRDSLEFRTALFRARQNRLAADRDHAELRIELDMQSVRQLREVELALGENEIALRATRALLDRYRSEATATRNAFGRVPDYILIRRDGDGFTTSIVDESTPLMRGDVVRVTFREGETARAGVAEQTAIRKAELAVSE
ncbi:polysaccharide biosynthesis/export family protein [Oricola thermophila]|uniref:Polysaccharide biosynthesis/export family protein n=1 Tax=Oricola thermophila TaxID=2742145 RepID=A0A6N1VAE2_9HYPH|nr:polysaccharide biosynthesis/export family protein [Oricola thermophila]QKV17924.1 polysaccharide biosynthesis/export family protein [Oricola thermophila]